MQYLLVVLIGALVAVADFLIKCSADSSPDFWQALRHRMMVWALLLYIFQMAGFVYLFQSRRWELSKLCITQMAVYALLSMFFGWCCGDKILPVNIIGVAVTLVGIVLANYCR